MLYDRYQHCYLCRAVGDGSVEGVQAKRITGKLITFNSKHKHMENNLTKFEQEIHSAIKNAPDENAKAKAAAEIAKKYIAEGMIEAGKYAVKYGQYDTRRTEQWMKERGVM
jgi:hypothetical protein